MTSGCIIMLHHHNVNPVPQRRAWSLGHGGDICRGMADVLVYALVPLALFVVAAVLLAGFLNFARGGSPQTSQKLMRWRVLMQFVALVVIMLAIWAIRG